MALGPRLEIRQSQSLVMTPQLQQAIKLLALSNLELETHVAEALEANPLLEIGEVSREATDSDGPETASEREADALMDGALGRDDAPLDIEFERPRSRPSARRWRSRCRCRLGPRGKRGSLWRGSARSREPRGSRPDACAAPRRTDRSRDT